MGREEHKYFKVKQTYSHPNGKRFESPINELKEQYIKWISELLEPIMLKYDIESKQFF